MALNPYRGRAVAATGTATAAAIAPYVRQAWNYLQTHGQPFPTRQELAAHSAERMAKRQRTNGARRIPRPVPGYTRVAGYSGYSRVGNKELKFYDADVENAVVATAGEIVGRTNATATPGTINAIAQGVTETTRVGRLAFIKKIGLRYSVQIPVVTNAEDVVRIMLYLDTQCNGATATVTDILESASYNSFNNLANKSRFRILMDRTHNLNPQSGTSAVWNENIQQYTFFKKCNIPIEFNNTTGALTEITSNNLCFLMISALGEAKFTGKVRLRFTD